MFPTLMMHKDALQMFADAIPVPTFVKDSAHRLVFVNKDGCEFFGYARDFLIGKSDFELFPYSEAREFRRVDGDVFASGKSIENEESVTTSSGDVRIVLTRKNLIRIEGEPFLIAVISDVTEFRKAEAQNRYLAFHDALTGLPNRVLLKERLEQALSRSHHESENCAIMLLDLDGFKQVNDTWGHQSGDELLKVFSQRLSDIVRPTDTVARLGGDEFAILLHNVEQQYAESLCFRVLAAASQPIALADTVASVGVSIGIAFASPSMRDSIELMRMADVALYRAKGEGRHRFRVFTEAMDQSIKLRASLEYDLREALQSGTGLEVYYQPVFSNHDGRPVELEALVRWNHPRKGFMMPAQFIGVAEETGLIASLCDWVLEQACQAQKEWPELSIGVNISPTQLTDADLATRLLDIVRRNGAVPERIVLEITENAVVKPSSLTLSLMQQFRAAGFRIALDDFGTGYSSLSHLQSLRVDKIKIDQSFIQRLGTSGKAEAIVEALCRLGSALGLQVTAEGVEQEYQKQWLSRAGCPEVQGYLLSRPLRKQHVRKALWNTGMGCDCSRAC